MKKNKMVKVQAIRNITSAKFGVVMVAEKVYDAEKIIYQNPKSIRYAVMVDDIIRLMVDVSDVVEIDPKVQIMDKAKAIAIQNVIEKANDLVVEHNGITTADEVSFLLGELQEADQTLSDIDSAEYISDIKKALTSFLHAKKVTDIMNLIEKVGSEKV